MNKFGDMLTKLDPQKSGGDPFSGAIAKSIDLVVQMGTAAAAAAEALKLIRPTDKLKDTLGLTGPDGKAYLDTILKPTTQIKDDQFTEIANRIKEYVSEGRDLTGGGIAHDIQYLKEIAHGYDNKHEGESNSGMIQAAAILEQQYKAATKGTDQKPAELKIICDEGGMIKVFAGSSGARKIVGNVFSDIARQEASSTMATGG